MRSIILFCLMLPLHTFIFCNEADSLLRTLDKSLSKRSVYLHQKENYLQQLKSSLNNSKTIEEEYTKTRQIVEEYGFFISDSALSYSKKCLDLALELKNDEYIIDTKLKRAYLLSLPQLFHESFKILESIDVKTISITFKRKLHYTYIYIYHNQTKDTDNLYYKNIYKKELIKHVNTYLSIGDKNSPEYLTILAYKYSLDGMTEKMTSTMELVLHHPDITPHIHAEFLLDIGVILMEAGLEHWTEAKKYLMRASIEYNQLAIKRNPPLMYLARILQYERDTDRAYRYMNMAKEDAQMFSNSHRYSMTEHTHTLIQNTYYDKIRDQQKSLQYYSISLSVFFILLLTMLVFIYRHNHILNKTKKQLFNANLSLKEDNHIKEIYIGRYLTMYSDYIVKFEDYRRFIIRKLKSGYTKELLKSENALLYNAQNEVDLLFFDFDNTFLELYPNFIENVNKLLHENSRYILKNEKRMNTELRILALLKLGISDNKVISSFLRITVQTLYNYRSKIKAKAINEDEFENDIQRISI